MSLLAGVLQDLRAAVRTVCRAPRFSLVAIATIALAIGTTASMFSFVQGVLLSPLPYPDPDRIVRVLERHPRGTLSGVSTLNYLDWLAHNSVFEWMAAEAAWTATLTGGDEPVSIRGVRVSPQYFEIFGVNAALGRTFLPYEDQPGNDRVVLLSHTLWERRFNANPALVGQVITLNGEPHMVVGVLPKGPFDRAVAQIWKPLAFLPAAMTRDFRWLGVTATLKPGVALDTARAEMNVIAAQLAPLGPSNQGWGVAVDRLGDVVIGQPLRTAVIILFAATLFVLLIGGANLAGLTLARSVSRERDFAVRSALGASRWRLVRQLIIENMALAAFGAGGALLVGYLMLAWIESLIPPSTFPPAVDVRMNATVVMFTLTVAVMIGALFGVAPALRTTHPSLARALKDGGPVMSASGPIWRLLNAFVAGEIALAFLLLVGSGLLLRSVSKLLDVDRGFTATEVLTANLPIAEDRHADPVDFNRYLESIDAAVRSVPGVRDTAMASALPLQGWGYGIPYTIAGRNAPDDPANRRSAFFKVVTPSYFDALGITLRAGRFLRRSDTAGAPPVAVINEALARREFPDENPIGQRLMARDVALDGMEFGRVIAWQIVGVVEGERITGLGDEVSGGMYVSYQQSPANRVNLIVNAGLPAELLERAVRSAIAEVSRDQALSDVRTLDEIVEQSMRANRVSSALLAGFASIALLLAAVGIYGVVSYTAAQRTFEMGVRAAVGASVGHLRRLIIRGAMRLAIIGLAVGVVAMFPVTDVLTYMLYGVNAYDPLTIAVVTVVLSAVVAVASLTAAWRISKLNPIIALRRQ